MKSFLLALALLVSLVLPAQHYYNDIEGARQLSDRMKTYVNAKVRSSMATGYDPQGAKSPDFNELVEVNAASRTLRISTRNALSITKQTYQFDENFKVQTIKDTSGSVQSVTTYTYDNQQRLVSLLFSTRDSINDFSQNELHAWIYGANGKPEKMWKIMDGKDSTEYRFTPDEAGNVGTEQLFRRNVGLEQIYYYYDDEKRMTDIVRFDKKLNKLLPDFMFEYDDNNRVIQKITTLATLTRTHPLGLYHYWDYIIWRFIYNDKGLKTKEVLFNKDKQQTGRIDYTFNFAP